MNARLLCTEHFLVACRPSDQRRDWRPERREVGGERSGRFRAVIAPAASALRLAAGQIDLNRRPLSDCAKPARTADFGSCRPQSGRTADDQCRSREAGIGHPETRRS